MVSTFLYVHGTGVREAAYDESFARIQNALKSRSDEPMARCYWGHLGARLNAGGLSVPTYDDTRAVAPGAASAPRGEMEVGIWALLLIDPLCELTALCSKAQAHGELPPGAIPPGLQLAERAGRFRPSTELQAKLDQAGIGETFRSAQDAVVATPAFGTAVGAATTGLAELRTAIARAWVAEAAARSEQQIGFLPALWSDADLRDDTVEQLVEALGGREYGLGDWVLRTLGGLALQVGSRLGTRYARRRRGAITDSAQPAAGDILLYQARGAEIRAFIRERILAAPAPVVLLSHSLGGIACVDLLVAEELQVQLLVTVGSQAPFLYEIGALQSLPFGVPLPDRFPPWLNVYDRRDLLSYVGGGVFPGRIRDVEVDSRQPFPIAHGAYWYNPATWQAIFQELG